MAYQIIWSPEALDDIDNIAEFIHRDSPAYAHSVVENIIAQSRELDHFALRGRVVPELEDKNYREVFIYNYRMIYYVDESVKNVSIVAVIHGARLLSVDRF
jgi:addiction module RelE/StbE family toxin